MVGAMDGIWEKEGGKEEERVSFECFGFRRLLFFKEGSRFVKDCKESKTKRLTIGWSCIDVAEEEGEKDDVVGGRKESVDLFKVTHQRQRSAVK